MLSSKFIQFNPVRVLSNVFRNARSFCTTTNAEGGVAGKVTQSENEVNEKKDVADKDAPKEEKVIEGNYYFETFFPYGKDNHKEKWITFYLVTPKGEKYKLRGYAGWGLLYAIRRNKLLHLFRPSDMNFCEDRNDKFLCSGCHVRLEREVFKTLPEMDENEYRYIKFQEDYWPGSSRLGCKITLQKSHDGTVIRLPKTHYVEMNYDDEDDFYSYR